MRSGGREVLSLALMDARNHTLQLFGQFQAALQEKNFTVPQLAVLNPPLWELGHIAWFQEWWIARNMQRALGSRCAPLHTRLASIEPQADCWWHAAQVPHRSRWSLDFPSAAGCRAYLLDTLESTLELLDKTDGSDDALYFYRLCLFHEDMHSEAMVMTAQTLGLPLDKHFLKAFTPASMALREPLLVPATRWQMGSGSAPDGGTAQPQGFVFDNELGAHSTDVPEFEIDAQSVTWAQFVEFVRDGGYDQRAWWSAGGWQWLQAQGRRAPRHVEQIGAASGAVLQTRFGQPHRLLGHQSALHISWWEADAWCRWAGRRLPAEVEWEVAASTAARRGFRWGDVWEWTGTTFNPYPGFSPHPYVEYSQPWFGNHMVLRGGSFATRARMKHPKYRNFYRPERDDVFCGFRSCAL